MYAIIGKLYSSLTIPQAGMVQGMQPLVGFNFGQRRFDRVRQTIMLALRASVGYGLLVVSVCWGLPAILIGFLSKEPMIVAEGQTALRIMAFAGPVGGISVMVAAFFQSTGRAREALTITLGGILLVKLPVLLLASHLFGLNGIWASEAVSETILCGVALALLRNHQEKAVRLAAPSLR